LKFFLYFLIPPPGCFVDVVDDDDNDDDDDGDDGDDDEFRFDGVKM